MLLSTILVLATLLRIGTVPIVGVTSYEWEIAYPTESEFFTTSEAQLEFNARPGTVMRFRARAFNGTWGAWGNWSYEVIADPLHGDLDYNCVVNTFDLFAANRAFGSRCP